MEESPEQREVETLDSLDPSTRELYVGNIIGGRSAFLVRLLAVSFDSFFCSKFPDQ